MSRVKKIGPRKDLAAAPHDSVFYGRKVELEKLSQWVKLDKCRVVTILGIGGMGKSALEIALARQIAREFPG